MKSKARHLVFLPLAAIAVCGTAGAADWEGDDIILPDDWHVATNWDTGVTPGVGGAIGEDVTFSEGDGDMVDLKSTDVSVGVFFPEDRTDFVNSTGGTLGAVTLTCTEMKFTDGGTKNGGQSTFGADLNIVVNGPIYSTRKSRMGPTFEGSVTAQTLADLGDKTTVFNGPLTVTTPSEQWKFKSRASGGNNLVIELNDTLTASTLSILSDSLSNPTRVEVGAANTLGGVSGAFNVNEGGQLDFTVTPTAFPAGGISLGQYGLLIGDTGAATWGSGNNIDPEDDAILATTAGTEPTVSDIGSGVVWKGVVDTGTSSAGASATSVYKGLAVGGFFSDLAGAVLEAPSGTGDVEILVLAGIGNNDQIADIVCQDGTGIGNFHCLSKFQSNGGRLNPNDLTNAVTTYNFIGESGNPANQMVDLYNNFDVESTETFNFSGEGWVEVDPTDMMGALTFSDDTMFAATSEQFENSGTTGFENVALTFNDGAAYSITNGEEEQLELLDFTSQVTQNGQPLLCLEGRDNAVHDINATENPNLIEFMKNANLCIYETNNDDTRYLGEGLVIGDGKYLLSFHNKGYHKLSAEPFHVDDNPYGPAKISGVSGAATMGLANISSNTGRNLEFLLTIDGNGAKIVANNSADMEYARPGFNTRALRAPAGKIDFSGTIEDTPGMDVLNGQIDFNDGVSVPAGFDLMVGAGATVNMDVTSALAIDVLSGSGTVNDADFLDFGTVAPGASIGTIDLGDVTLDGSAYDCEISGAAAVAGTDNDLIIGGTVTLGTWTLNLVGLGLNAGDLDGTEVFTIIDASNSIVDFNAGNVTITGVGLDTSSAVVQLNPGDDSIVEVTGLLIDAGGSDPYGDWAGGFAGLTDTDVTLDFDSGGLETGIEWVVGGDPTDGSDDSGLAPTFDNTTDPDKFLFVYRRTDEANEDADTTIAAQYGSTLTGWTTAAHQGAGPGDITITEDDEFYGAGVDKVTVAIPRGLAVGDALFARLNVTVAGAVE